MELNWCFVCRLSEKGVLLLFITATTAEHSALQSSHTVPVCAEEANLMAVPQRKQSSALHITGLSCCYWSDSSLLFCLGCNCLTLKELPVLSEFGRLGLEVSRLYL